MPNETFSEQESQVLLTAAAMAPSMHNTQPWRFAVAEHVVEVWLDRSRALPAEDPQGRALHVSAGAVLHNLRVASAHLGYAADVVALPDPAQPDLAGRVRVDVSSSPEPALGGQFGAIAARHTNRAPFAERAVPAGDIDVLVQAAESEGVHLQAVTDPDDVHRLVGLAYDAERDDAVEEARIKERQAWVGGDRDRDRIPSSALGPRSHDRRAPVRDLAVNREDRCDRRRALSPTRCYSCSRPGRTTQPTGSSPASACNASCWKPPFAVWLPRS